MRQIINTKIVPLYFLCCVLGAIWMGAAVADNDDDIGIPECEQIVGVDRHIQIGHPVLYIVKYLEGNNYACSKYLGNASEVISCRLRSNQRAEILLTIENGKVTDIETLDNGKECSYFNIKEDKEEKFKEK